MFKAISDFGVVGKAIDKELMQLNFVNPRDFSANKHNSVDDRPYGGGPGMVMQYQPLKGALLEIKTSGILAPKVIYMSPQGEKVTQKKLTDLVNKRNEITPIFISGRYEGVDQRFIDAHVDEEWSIGDYVISGGELAIMVVLDAMARLIPGTLGSEESHKQDSFICGLLDYPSYTRPEKIDGFKVPDVLLSGDHKDIATWRLKQQLGRTWQKRPDLLKKINLNLEQQILLQEFIEEAGE